MTGLRPDPRSENSPKWPANLDVYSGLASQYRIRHSNLRADGAGAVLSRALATAASATTRCDSDLARSSRWTNWPRYGDTVGLGAHPGPESARHLRLDRAR